MAGALPAGARWSLPSRKATEYRERYYHDRPQRFSRTHSDIFGLFKAELARAGAITGFLDAGASLWPRFAACYEGVARLPRKARRALQRRWRRSLAGIALLHALGQVPAALAAQIDVGAGGCTLVDAITAANADQPTGVALPVAVWRPSLCRQGAPKR
jgi:hypothetical protein